MNILTPEWLALRGGSLKLSRDGQTWYVLIGDQPHYALTPVPAGGRYGCYIKQTINGKPIECKSRAENRDAALLLGLEELKNHLGW